jgi:hypothetical protein
MDGRDASDFGCLFGNCTAARASNEDMDFAKLRCSSYNGERGIFQ